MNVYQITVDGQAELWAGTNMPEACKGAEDDYIRQLREDAQLEDEGEQRLYFQTDLLESCQLVGEVKNWPRRKASIEIVEAERPE